MEVEAFEVDFDLVEEDIDYNFVVVEAFVVEIGFEDSGKVEYKGDID